MGEEADLRTLASRLHEHLSATAERPVERTASRWLGEAEAVAADAARDDASAEVVAKRAEQVEELLSHVEGTGDETADDHVAAARDLATRIATRVD
jgi:hypothetical protein